MDYRTVGNSGLKVSTLGLGCNNFGGRLDEAASHNVIHAALDAGVTLFDTADVYGGRGPSERIVGTGLGARRADVVLATKFGMKMNDEGTKKGGSRRYMMAAVEDSLSRLGTDWIDLLYLHAPDPETPIEETLKALDDLVRQGKVRYIASSNFSAWQQVEAQLLARELGTERFIATQEEYSLLVRDVEDEVLPVCKKYGVGLVPYFPLTSGLLSGKVRKGQPVPEGSRLTPKEAQERWITEARLDKVEELAGKAEAAGGEIIDLAFAWLLRDPVVPSVIAGATKVEQIERNAKAVAWTMPEGLEV